MSDFTDAEIVRRRAEEVLIGARASSQPIGRLLREAGAPGHPDELRGEQAALAEFRAAGSAPTTGAASPTSRRWLPVKGLTAAAVGVAAIAVGFGAAAATGSLPNWLQRPAHDIFHAPAPHSTQGPTPSPGSDTSHPDSPGSTSSSGPGSRTGSPSGASTQPSSPGRSRTSERSTSPRSPSGGLSTSGASSPSVAGPAPATASAILPTTTLPTRTVRASVSASVSASIAATVSTKAKHVPPTPHDLEKHSKKPHPSGHPPSSDKSDPDGVTHSGSAALSG